MYRCRFLNVNLTVVNQERGKDGGWTCNDEAEHFSLIPELEPRSAWMSQHCQQVRTNLKAYMCVSQGNQWRSDKLIVRLISGVPWGVVGDGSWAGLSRVCVFIATNLSETS